MNKHRAQNVMQMRYSLSLNESMQQTRLAGSSIAYNYQLKKNIRLLRHGFYTQTAAESETEKKHVKFNPAQKCIKDRQVESLQK